MSTRKAYLQACRDAHTPPPVTPLPEEQPKILVYIPARGGSKGLPGKNIIPLGPRPLIAYAIAPALALPGNVRVMVDTDAEDIAAMARRWGAETPFLREAALADDCASPGVAQSRFLQRLAAHSGYVPSIIMTLFVTSPFRTTALLRQALHILLEGRGSNVVTALHTPLRAGSLFAPGPHGLRPLPELLPELRSGTWGSRLYRPCPLVMARWSWSAQPDHILEVTDADCAVDIDTPEDLALAQTLLAQRGWTEQGWEKPSLRQAGQSITPQTVRQTIRPACAATPGREMLCAPGTDAAQRERVLRAARELSHSAGTPMPVCGVRRADKDHPARLRAAHEILLEDMLLPATRMDTQNIAGPSAASILGEYREPWSSPSLPLHWPASTLAYDRFAPALWGNGFGALSAGSSAATEQDKAALEWHRLDAQRARALWRDLPCPPALKPHMANGSRMTGQLLFSVSARPHALVCTLTCARANDTPVLYTDLPLSVPCRELRLECRGLRRVGHWFAHAGHWACAVRIKSGEKPLLLRILRHALPGSRFDLWRPLSAPLLWTEDAEGTLTNALSGSAITGRQQLPHIWALDGTLYLPEGWTAHSVAAVARGHFLPLAGEEVRHV